MVVSFHCFLKMEDKGKAKYRPNF